MFKDIGNKLKSIANISCWLEIIIFTLFGLIVLISEENGMGLVIILLGIPTAWLSNCILYAFGQLVDDAHKLVRITNEQRIDLEEEAKDEINKLDLLNELKNESLISDEEYKNKLENIK